MLLHISQLLTIAEVKQFRAELDSVKWVDGRATVGVQGAQVKRNRQIPIDNPIAQRLGENIIRRLYENPLFLSAALPNRIVPPLFNLYEVGETYGYHVDGAIRFSASNAPNIRTDISCTLFLSEPDEYEGGELVIQDTYGSHQVKLPAGDLILYPATSLHKVEPVTKGARMASFFWVQSMVKDDWQRSLLFECDKNIQSLRARLGDTSELVGLTGHYHNLLRQWSQV